MKQTNEQLSQFVAKARAAGKSDADIQTMLATSGWDLGVVAQALMPTGDLVPPAPPAPKSSGREIFFYLLQFITLGIAATSLGGVMFAAINRYYPDVVGNVYGSDSGAIPWPLASLIVAAPVFFAITWVLVRDVAAGRTSAMSKVRRVLIYLALFLAAATVIGDLIALVDRFLAGEVNARFLLKVLTILLIGGWVIVYYFVTVKRDERKAAYPKAWHRAHGIAFTVVVVAAIAFGFYLNGTPFERQQAVRDQQRVTDLQSIYNGVTSYYSQKGRLPADLGALQNGYAPTVPQDPLTGQPYEYKPGSGTAVQICATFEAAEPAGTSPAPRAVPLYSPYDVNWTHPAGHYCFDLDLKPILPPLKP